VVLNEQASSLAQRFLELGSSPSDTDQERAYKATHVLMSAVTAAVVSLWSIVYLVLGLGLSAAIPLVYAGLTLAGLVVLTRTKQIGLFRASQMAMWLIFPFLLQWSLGGFVNGSAVAMWAVGAPLLASLIGAVPGPWFLGFVGLSAISGFIDSSLAATAPNIPQGVITTLFVLNFLGVAFVIFVSLRYFVRERERAREALETEREKSERLLLNILPEEVATRLKAGEGVIADRIDDVTILFADLVGSTPLSERLSPDELVSLLNEIVTPFDDLADRLGLEKIKIIGDAYMVVGGLPTPRPDHAEAVADMALAMREELKKHTAVGLGPLQMRFGIHTGTVVAGVIGKRKFSYDLYGDAVNVAARMESQGIPDEIQVSEQVYQELRNRYLLEPRGPVDIKGKGVMNTYLLKGAGPRSGDEN
jgi:adenylate cyclase